LLRWEPDERFLNLYDSLAATYFPPSGKRSCLRLRGAGRCEFQKIRFESYGTAGSATLVFQTILPALMTASGPSEITIEGGTHNMQAPPSTFSKKSSCLSLGPWGQKSRSNWNGTASIQQEADLSWQGSNHAEHSNRFSCWIEARSQEKLRPRLLRICREILRSESLIPLQICSIGTLKR